MMIWRMINPQDHDKEDEDIGGDKGKDNNLDNKFEHAKAEEIQEGPRGISGSKLAEQKPS